MSDVYDLAVIGSGMAGLSAAVQAVRMGIQMVDPIAESVVIEQPAPARLTTLDGKVVGLYTNTKLNATKVLEMAADIIQQRFTRRRALCGSRAGPGSATT